MSYDIHYCLRGSCLACDECPSFISLSGKILCDYCGCPPARHTKLNDDKMMTREHYKSPYPTSKKATTTRDVFKDLRGQTSSKSATHPRVQNSSKTSTHPRVNRRNAKTEKERVKTRNNGRGKSGSDRSLGKAENAKSNLNKVKAGRNSKVVKRPTAPQKRMPRRVDLLLDLPEVKLGWSDQAKHGWNDADRSHNLYLNDTDKMTFHRLPIAQSTDGIRTLTSYERGLHVLELTWSSKQRGTHAVVGVATAEAPVHSNGYVSLVGSDAHSWGWDLGRSKAYHDGGNNKNGTRYPAFLGPADSFKVPDKFLMIIDMDEGTLAFAVDDQHLGVAHTGLKGQKVFPMVSTVWGRCEISIKYVGGMDSQPMPLMDLCSQAVRSIMGSRMDGKSLEKLNLPKTLVKYLDLKDKDMVQHFKDKDMISQV